MKLLKIYIINCPNTSETQIYCIKHESSEDLTVLKEKIFLRCPLLKLLSYDPQIYWYDLENDKIKITCDDDLRFFMEESEVTKLTVDYRTYELSTRKRHLTDDECSESSRKIRRKLQSIELDSESSMDTDEFNIEKDIESQIVQKTIPTTIEEQPVPSTSKDSVKILNVEVIKPASNDEVDKAKSSDEEVAQIINENNLQVFDENNVELIPISEQQKKRKTPDSNKIVISDSSDDEEDSTRRNRRHSDGNYSSSYSFAANGPNGSRYEHRTSYDDNFRYFQNHRHYHQFRPRYRNEQHFENINRIYQNANNIRENALRNAETIRERALSNIRNSANMLPQILSTFQAHFRPLFQQSGFNSQQHFSRTYRH